MTCPGGKGVGATCEFPDDFPLDTKFLDWAMIACGFEGKTLLDLSDEERARVIDRAQQFKDEVSKERTAK